MLLLDLDGTLSDPLVGIGRSLNHALEAHGHPARPLEALAFAVGPPLDESLAKLSGSREPAQVQSLVASYRERYGRIGYSENTLYPGIPEAIAALRAKGRTLALCTSKRADFAEQILRMFGLREAFSFISGGDVGIQKGQQIESLLREGRIGPDACMIGDRALDIEAARRNGLKGIGVLWGYGSRSELEAAGPDLLLDAPSALAEL
nr:HAD hydrolase-like protein [uncultured Holophaga sp.]